MLGNVCLPPRQTDSFPGLNRLSWWEQGDFNKCNFLTFYNGICQHLRYINNSVNRYFWPMHNVSKSCINKEPIQSVTECEEFLIQFDTLITSQLLLGTAKSKNNIHQLSGKATKISSLCHLLLISEFAFSLCTTTKATYHNIFNAEEDNRNQMCPMKPDFRGLQNWAIMSLFLNASWKNMLCFILKIWFMLICNCFMWLF